MLISDSILQETSPSLTLLPRHKMGSERTDAVAPTSSSDLQTEIYEDHLTKIGNRRFFEQRLEHSLASGSLLTGYPSLLLLDLDRFKAVNDSLGHHVGDVLLRLVAERLTQLLNEGDVVGRLGGDEFGIITNPLSNAGDLAARIIDLVQRTYLVEGCPVNIGVSIGIAQAPEDATEAGQLLKKADLALYQAKAFGRSGFTYFHPSMEANAKERRELELAIRKAVPLRQLELHYSAQVDIESNRLVGFESALRWNHPVRGVLEASAFMPVAEEIGVVVAIGEWVLKAACQEAARWPEDVTVAISVSPVQFETDRFFEAVRRTLHNAGIGGHKLELGVTESILLRDGKSVLAQLNKLRAIGVKVSIDSFGTGIASLSQMVEFPLDKIKIDRTLVRENGGGVKERAIVRSIAALGEGLGVSTLAEGVSTPEHLATIQRDGCSSVKGYLSSDSVPSSELRALVQELLTVRNTNHQFEVLS